MNDHFFKIHKWLYPVSWLYGTAIFLRNKFFDWRLLPSRSYTIPVISIGNLAVGGTGKTPHTEYLIRLLKDHYRIAVLSRGYKRSTRGFVLATPESTAKTIGDEPYQMHSKFPSVTVAVDESRCHGIEQLLSLEAAAPELILLDDAFQHRYVKPGLSILLTDYHRLFCDDALLPAGRLREPVSGKNRAQIVIVTKCPQDIKPIDYNIIAKRMNLFPYQQLYFSSFRYGKLRPLFQTAATPNSSDGEIALSALTETSILLVTGIASPRSIASKLKEYSRRVETIPFGDHHDFSAKDMQQVSEHFHRLSGKRRLLVTTEKDATRLISHPHVDEQLKPYIYVLPIEIEILQNQQDKFNQQIIDYVRENTRNNSLS